MTRPGNLAAAGLCALVISSGAHAQAAQAEQTPPEPADSFVERVDVTAVELMIDVRDRRGVAVHGLTPADFIVLEDDREMEVIGIDPPARPSAAPSAAEADPPALGGEAPAWRFLVYFDLVLTQQRSVRRAIETLGMRLEEMAAMGPIELVAANPVPRIVLPFTRDPKRLRQELDGLANLQTNHQIANIRRDFLHLLDMRLHRASPGPSETAAVLNQIRTAANKEFLLLNRRLITLGQWLGAYGHVPASTLILVSDGFDLAPAEFYLSATSLPGAEAELSLELDRFRVDPLTEAVARELAARGWTSVVLSLGGISELATGDASLASRDRFRSIGELSDLSAGPETGSPTAILQHPLEPLAMVADETGGEVMTARRTAGQALERIGDRIRLTYAAARPPDGRVHRVTVQAKRPELVVRAPGWVRSPTREQTAAARARRLLILGLEVGELPVRLAVEDLGRGPEDTRRAQVEIFFDLNLVRAVLPRPSLPMAFTFGVDVPEAPPLVYELTQTVTLPAGDDSGEWPDFLYRVVLDVPAKARRLSIVVEEPASGFWGGTTRELAR